MFNSLRYGAISWKLMVGGQLESISWCHRSQRGLVGVVEGAKMEQCGRSVTRAVPSSWAGKQLFRRRRLGDGEEIEELELRREDGLVGKSSHRSQSSYHEYL